MVKKTLTAASCLATGCGYLYFKDSIDENLKAVYEKTNKFRKDHPTVVIASCLGGTALAGWAVFPYISKAWNYLNMGMEFHNMARQFEKKAAVRDSESMSRHSQQWRQYALKTALQINIECRKKLEGHYNITEILVRLKEKLPKEEKIDAWNKLKIATFSILFINHFQTVFVWLKTRLIFSICFRRDYQKLKQDQTLTGPQLRSTENNDQQRFLSSLSYPEGDTQLLVVVENCVKEVLGERPLAEQFSLEGYIELLTKVFTLVKQKIFLSPHKMPKEFFIASLVKRDQPSLADLAEMEGELHLVLDSPDTIYVLNKALAETLEKIIAEGREVFSASKKKKSDSIFLVNLITETRTLTKTIMPMLDIDSFDPGHIMDPLSTTLEINGFNDFFNVVSNIN